MIFNYDQDFKAIDFRKHPELYEIGKGEMGVLLVEPYKSEILPYWRFKNPEVAKISSTKIYELFLTYLAEDDFVGADMARKYLQMGWTRARRYANHKSGKKYSGPIPKDKKGQSGSHGREVLPRQADDIKAESAQIFFEKYILAKVNKKYLQLKRQHQKKL